MTSSERAAGGPGVKWMHDRALEPEEVRFWRRAVRRAVAAVGTPCFVFAAEPLQRQAELLDQAFEGLPVRHWWSYKTLPLPAAADWWFRRGRPVEVVSELELRAVLEIGFDPADILVNGPAKHAWLARYPIPGLGVNFDSVAEIRTLASMAKRCAWRVGARLSLRAEDNFEYPGIRAQFGLAGAEVDEAARLLRRAGLPVEVLHFHLRTNVPEPRYYREAVAEALERAMAVGWRAPVLDMGGGFPPARVASRKGASLDAGFSLAAMRAVVKEAVSRHGLRELWMENGRWLTAPCGVLAVGVLDVKGDPTRGARTLVCDGGRTLQAMVATWERHAVVPLVNRRGAGVPTILHGPTCMAFDNLGIHPLPGSVGEGDVLIWSDAGAYQLGWETRFSHELAPICWWEADSIHTVRPKVHCQVEAIA